MSRKRPPSSAVRVTYADGRQETRAADSFGPKAQRHPKRQGKRSRPATDGNLLDLLARLRMLHYTAAKQRDHGEDSAGLEAKAAALEVRIDRWADPM